MPIKSDWHIRHDGKEYPAGEVVSLPEKAEKELVEGGQAEYVEQQKAKGRGKSDDPAEL